MEITKGKWGVLIQRYKKAPKEICTGVGIKSDMGFGAYFTMICDMVLPDSDKEYIEQHEEIKANAELIAAAPETLKQRDEFLEALKHVVAKIDQCFEMYGGEIKVEAVVKLDVLKDEMEEIIKNSK